MDDIAAAATRSVNLAAHDLNLLVAFEALMSERHVTRAAARVGLSQSAMSHTLGRLRSQFNDRLFVRQRNAMIPTERAFELAATIDPALALLRDAMLPRRQFSPRSSERRFVIGMNDAVVAGMLPLVLPQLRREAPSVAISVMDLPSEKGVEALRTGLVEAAFDVYGELPEGYLRQPLVRVDLVGIADRRNPLIVGGKVSREAFLTAPHVKVAMANYHTSSSYDEHLGLLGFSRRVVCETPFFSSAAALVRNSDLIGVVGRHALGSIANLDDFVLFDLPIPPPSMSCEMIWHPRSKADAGISWLGRLFRQALSREDTAAAAG